MKEVSDAGVQVLCCESVALTAWGREEQNFRAPHWRIYWNHEAGAGVRFRGRVVDLDPAKVFAIPPDTDFSPSLRSPVRHFFIHFTAGPPYDRCEPGVYGMDAARTTVRRLQSIEAMRAECSSDVVPRLRAAILAAVYEALAGLPEGVLRSPAADERMERAVAVIRANLRAPPANDDLAALAHMSVSAFICRFRRIFGESPQAYSRRKRIERACVLLHYTDASIDKVAEDTGFCDRYHFSRVFRRLRGMGPAAFREIGLLPSPGRNQ